MRIDPHATNVEVTQIQGVKGSSMGMLPQTLDLYYFKQAFCFMQHGGLIYDGG